ncbi:MAG: LemA family protein [Candidatus Pacebacteria bacterium]|nr:LemA family protein [Candidatus Paceibacterota bacterium]MCF7857645.1 LemA family protein [Candidatus Paceibacterota bacterium]
MSPTFIVLIVAAVVVFWVIIAYNNFVKFIQRTKEAWADIDVQLKRRYDLIPNLIETVKGYASHERETFDAVTSARAEATKVHVDPSMITPENLAAMAGAEAGLGQALGKLLAVAEAYPDLKANTNFLELQRELSDTENKIQAARRFYNGNVRDLKIALQSFPSNMVGKMFSFKEEPYFELGDDAAAREPVAVSFK